jgi:hypothetical protein
MKITFSMSADFEHDWDKRSLIGLCAWRRRKVAIEKSLKFNLRYFFGDRKWKKNRANMQLLSFKSFHISLVD